MPSTGDTQRRYERKLKKLQKKKKLLEKNRKLQKVVDAEERKAARRKTERGEWLMHDIIGGKV